MKFQPEKTKATIESLLDQELQLEGDINGIQRQIQELEVQYLQKSWPDGNVYIGWNKNIISNQIANNKVNIYPNATSDVQHQVQKIADKNISPWGQNKFESIRKRNKLSKMSQMRRAKSQRKKKRR